MILNVDMFSAIADLIHSSNDGYGRAIVDKELNVYAPVEDKLRYVR
jgi:hypothetical protein